IVIHEQPAQQINPLVEYCGLVSVLKWCSDIKGNW
ncbi:unnamed protein product, partial [marine sediment metagenome]